VDGWFALIATDAVKETNRDSFPRQGRATMRSGTAHSIRTGETGRRYPALGCTIAHTSFRRHVKRANASDQGASREALVLTVLT
jgi:hypothetical protein